MRAQVLCQWQVAPGAALLAAPLGARGDDFVPSLHAPSGAAAPPARPPALGDQIRRRCCLCHS